jgi:hypothetical protein
VPMIEQIASMTEISLPAWQGLRLILAMFLGWWQEGEIFEGFWGCIIEFLGGCEALSMA